MLPEKFSERMKKILSEDYISYENAVVGIRQTGLRVNTVKCENPKAVIEKLPFDCETIGYASDCYYFEFEKPGNLPLHHAGAFYVQEPSAMAPVSALEGLLPNGIKILDSCASPGGKTSQAVCFCHDKNIVFSNEIVPSRCKTLVGNIERQGFKNSVVLNGDTAYLSKEFKGEFALVICDAPCSGEGMFRKSREALSEWSPENVSLCAQRQKEILDNLSSCVCDGGYLLYSTCTFSPEENEMNVSYFLKKHPDFSLCEISDKFDNCTVCGIKEYCDGFDYKNVRRFYPHTGRGEGQFFAIFKKDGELLPSTVFSYADGSRKPDKNEQKAIDEFLKSTIGKIPENIRIYGENILILPDGLKIPAKKVFSCGVKLGEYKNGRIIPHHHFFSAFGKEFKNKVDLSCNSAECLKYLKGEGFDVCCENGWCSVCIEGIPAGGGKVVNGYLKNHYPKGLRLMGD
ncbi:MAG: hypothetical protein E7621_06370 [Ruminococcaceae bacterium]|nr:hypothetical protein [Oscillospiraceae bacterium]